MEYNGTFQNNVIYLANSAENPPSSRLVSFPSLLRRRVQSVNMVNASKGPLPFYFIYKRSSYRVLFCVLQCPNTLRARGKYAFGQDESKTATG